MALYVVSGGRKTVARELIRYAIKHQPAFVIDAANAADPHQFYPEFMPEDLERVMVCNVELLYKLRQYVLALPLGLVIITPFHILMHYQDQEENESVLRHMWELLREKGAQQKIIVGVPSRSTHEKLGAHYGKLVEDVWAIP